MAREETVFLMLDLHWQELCRLRDSNTTPVCKVGGINVAKCDAINLGCLYQCYPDLCDPRDTEKSYCKSVSSLAEGPKGILDLCGALVRKFGEHQPCAVGARLAAQAAELMKAVHGLDLGA